MQWELTGAVLQYIDRQFVSMERMQGKGFILTTAYVSWISVMHQEILRTTGICSLKEKQIVTQLNIQVEIFEAALGILETGISGCL